MLYGQTIEYPAVFSISLIKPLSDDCVKCNSVAALLKL
ncbi:hypothetical protein E9Y_08581 [Moraxella catarrhalis 101P30B1]|nr:hypothetical protein E9Y_08581 [Moraxella catarrhalis 101P30B1]